MPRPSAEERRRDYLELGAEIVGSFSREAAEAATVDALADVKVAEVADRAGVTKGAVYHVWPSQEAYRHDLLARLLEQNRQAGVREMVELLRDPAVLERDPRETLRRYADFVFDALKDDPAFFARFSFFLYAANPEVGELLARGDDGVIEDFAPYVERYLELRGRRIRPPYTTALLLRSMNALFQGLCLRHRCSPELVESPERRHGEGSSLYADGVDALVEQFSEPVD